MIFKVKWGDIKNEFTKQIMVGNLGEETPIKFYFEDESSLIVFIKIRGTVVCSSIPKIPELDVKDFKMSFLSDSFELQENPLSTSGNITLYN